MRKYLLFALLICFSTLNAQWVITIGKKTYHKATVTLEDGTVKEGFVRDFQARPTFQHQVELDTEAFKAEEENLGLKRDFYHFRIDEKAKDEKIPMQQIKSIVFTQFIHYLNKEQTMHFEKVKLARIKNNGETKYYKGDFLLPVYFSNSKLTIYHFNQILCTGKKLERCEVYPLNFYFKAKDDEYAIKPIHIDTGTLFALGKIADKYNASFEYLGKNCPKFLEEFKSNPDIRMTQAKALSRSKNKRKNSPTERLREDFKKDIEAAKKEYNKEELQNYREERFEQYIIDFENLLYNNMYDELITTFINSCE